VARGWFPRGEEGKVRVDVGEEVEDGGWEFGSGLKFRFGWVVIGEEWNDGAGEDDCGK
jgi:hypothetical protein